MEPPISLAFINAASFRGRHYAHFILEDPKNLPRLKRVTPFKIVSRRGQIGTIDVFVQPADYTALFDHCTLNGHRFDSRILESLSKTIDSKITTPSSIYDRLIRAASFFSYT